MPEQPTTTILIVDDDIAIQRNIEKMLTKNGYTTMVASNGIETINLLEQQPFDLILLDMMMPDWTGVFSKQAGLSILKEIRDRGWQVPVIILTASDSVGTAVSSMKFGAFDYLEKGNISSKDFVEKIEQALQVIQNSPNNPSSTANLSHTSKYHPKWKNWLIERSTGLIDEILGAIVVGFLLYLFGNIAGVFKTDSLTTVLYIGISVIIIVVLLTVYILWQRKHRQK